MRSDKTAKRQPVDSRAWTSRVGTGRRLEPGRRASRKLLGHECSHGQSSVMLMQSTIQIEWLNRSVRFLSDRHKSFYFNDLWRLPDPGGAPHLAIRVFNVGRLDFQPALTFLTIPTNLLVYDIFELFIHIDTTTHVTAQRSRASSL